MKDDMLYQLTHEGYFDLRFPKVTMVNVLAVLRSHQEEERYQKQFKSIYDQYKDTNFLVSKLSQKDQEIILAFYMKTIYTLTKERLNDIQTKETSGSYRS